MVQKAPDAFSLPLVVCPSCGHGIDPHDPAEGCGVGDSEGVRCPCLWSPNDIAATYLIQEKIR